MKRAVLTSALTLGLALAGPKVASASLIYDASISVSGSGLGAVTTLVTAHETGGNPATPGTESNCVQWIAGADSQGACLGNYIVGGDPGGQGNVGTKTLAEIGALKAGDVGVVVNLSETGQDLTVQLQALALIFYNMAGTQLGAFFLDPALVGTSYTSGEGTGLGGSGFVFRLDAAQQAQANALVGVHRVGGGLSVSGFNDGQETMYLFNIPGGTPTIPEPASLLLFGTGLAGVGKVMRRRFKNQNKA